MNEPFLLPGDDEVSALNTDWLVDERIMTLKEREDEEKRVSSQKGG